MKDGLGSGGHPLRQCRLLNEGGDHAVGAHHHVVAADDGTGARDTAANAVLELKVPAGKGQSIQQRPDLCDVGAGVHERPQSHVSGNTGEAMEPGDGGETRAWVGHGRILAMAQAAP